MVRSSSSSEGVNGSSRPNGVVNDSKSNGSTDSPIPGGVSSLALKTPQPQGSASGTHMNGSMPVSTSANGAEHTGSSSATKPQGRVLDFDLAKSNSLLEESKDETSSARTDPPNGSDKTSHIQSDMPMELGEAFEPSSQAPTEKSDSDEKTAKEKDEGDADGPDLNATDPVLELMDWLRANYTFSPASSSASFQKVSDVQKAAFRKFSKRSGSLPKGDDFAAIIVQTFPDAIRELLSDGTTIIKGLEKVASDSSKGSGKSTSNANRGRHRYTASCNLSDLAAIAAIEQESMNGSESQALSSANSDAQPGSPPREKVPMSPSRQVAIFGTPRRSALDELAAAAALSERSPMAMNKARREETGEELDSVRTQQGLQNKKRKVEHTQSLPQNLLSPGARSEPGTSPGTPTGLPVKTNNRGAASTRRKGQKMAHARSASAVEFTSAGPSGSQLMDLDPSSSRRSASSRTANGSSKSKKSIYTSQSTTSPSDPTVKHYKPNFTYHELITHEIKRSSDGRLQLSEIYRRISERYPYFKLGDPGWQNSIRHNLSLKKCFVRVDRPSDATDKSGKGGWWTYVPTHTSTDSEGRPTSRKALSGKGTGEYRKGSTPSDIASRSPTPEAISTRTEDVDHSLWTQQAPQTSAFGTSHHLRQGLPGQQPPQMIANEHPPASHPSMDASTGNSHGGPMIDDYSPYYAGVPIPGRPMAQDYHPSFQHPQQVQHSQSPLAPPPPPPSSHEQGHLLHHPQHPAHHHPHQSQLPQAMHHPHHHHPQAYSVPMRGYYHSQHVPQGWVPPPGHGAAPTDLAEAQEALMAMQQHHKPQL